MSAQEPGPYFKTVKSFADVPVSDGGVETSAFLDASDGLVQLFDLLGSGIFGFVQADLRKNIQGVRERYAQSPSASFTLEGLVQHEIEEGSYQASACLLRLLRGLSFTCTALQNSRGNRGEELTASFKRAYDTNLRHHHGFFVRTVVSVAIKACPRRDDFYTRIAQGEPQDSLDAELEKWLGALESIVNRMADFYERSGHGRL